MSVPPVRDAKPPAWLAPKTVADQAAAWRGAIAFAVIFLVAAAVQGAYFFYGKATGSTAHPPWWSGLLIAVALAVLLALTHDRARQYWPHGHGRLVLFNFPFMVGAVAGGVALNAALTPVDGASVAYLPWITVVVSLSVAVTAVVIDCRQGAPVHVYIPKSKSSFAIIAPRAPQVQRTYSFQL